MLASAQNAEQRTRIYEGLEQRNRLVAILRIGLPVLGALVLAGLLLQIFVASLLDEFGISNIRIDRDNLVVETPSYSSMAADGTMYAMASEDARAALGDTDLLHLTKAQLMVTKPNASWMQALAEQADMRLSSQLFYVPGAMAIADSRGTRGTVTGVHADMSKETLISDGPARITYYNGTTLDAASMTYDGKRQLWQFRRATLVVPGTPGAPKTTQTTEPAVSE